MNHFDHSGMDHSMPGMGDGGMDHGGGHDGMDMGGKCSMNMLWCVALTSPNHSKVPLTHYRNNN